MKTADVWDNIANLVSLWKTQTRVFKWNEKDVVVVRMIWDYHGMQI